MGYTDKVKNLSALAYRQATGFVEIVRLKLRILGFSNKRGGLVSRLGEIALKSIGTGKSLVDDPETTRLVNEIKEAEREISNAQTAITRRKEDDRIDRQADWEKRSPANEDVGESLPAGDIADEPDSGKVEQNA